MATLKKNKDDEIYLIQLTLYRRQTFLMTSVQDLKANRLYKIIGNRSGPRIEPWGILQVIRFFLDNTPFTVHIYTF